MILTITLSPCIDKSSSAARFEPEIKIRCTPLVYEPGGGGINVSKALKKLGAEAKAVFPAGGHNGNMLCALLEDAGIAFERIDCSAETRENWVMLQTTDNAQYRFNFPGQLTDIKTIEILIERIADAHAGFVVASGSLPEGLPENTYARIVAAANAAGAACIVDTSGKALAALKGCGAFLIKPNAGELSALLGLGKLDKEDVPAAARQLIAANYAANVAVSMGATGAWLVTANESFFCAAPVVKKLSTVGAGDSMVAGMVYKLQQKASLPDVLKFGVACGTAATMHAGTKLFEREDAEDLFAKM